MSVLILEIRVEAKEVGVSKRGLVKRRPLLRVRYCFEPPETRADATGAQFSEAIQATR